MIYRKTNSLTEDARRIREEVFVTEQGFSEEFDEIDKRAVHLVCYMEGEPAAVCRYFEGTKPYEYVAGRIAVRKAFRGRKIGNELMQILEETIKAEGGRSILLSAQLRVAHFYEAAGYEKKGEPYLDEHCLHIKMEKKLNF